MCDEMTEAENAAWMRDKGLNRREFASVGAGAAALSMLPGCTTAGEMPSSSATASRTVIIDTPAGKADAFFVYPA
ncbi:MAG: dienelactone hydrolase family protein, partial [Pseudomonadota bacterium]